MATQQVINKHGMEFPWVVKLSRKSKGYSSLDEHIRRCAQDRVAVDKKTKDAAFVATIEKLFSEEKDLLLFVHQSQMMFNPVFCILVDIATPEEHSLLQETLLAISWKFESFKDKETRKQFLELLYSNENIARLKKFKLKIESIGAYEY